MVGGSNPPAEYCELEREQPYKSQLDRAIAFYGGKALWIDALAF